MEYVKLGNSDLNVSRICLGCMGFGEAAAGQHRWTLDEESSNEIIKAALENGINFFDTAMSYQGGTPVCTAWRSLCPFKGIIISFSARRSAKWRHSARRRTLR